MTLLNKAVLFAAAVALAGCAGPDRFGAGGDDMTDGASAGMSGAANDPTSVAYFQQTVGDRVLFSVDESTLSPEARATIDAQVAWLQRNPDYEAVIEGHADEQGTREYNLALGARRANSVMEYMVAQGVAQNRLRFVSFGKERPAELCSDETCYQQNRRAVTVLAAGAALG